MKEVTLQQKIEKIEISDFLGHQKGLQFFCKMIKIFENFKKFKDLERLQRLEGHENKCCAKELFEV